jgi:autotransporter-associated beta strand protein
MNSDESLRRLLHDAARSDVDEALEAALDEAAKENAPLSDDTVTRMVREATQSGPHSPLCGMPRTAQRTVRTTFWALAVAASVVLGFTWLTQKQPPSIPAETLVTKSHERRVERLKDDSLLYLDENTHVTITSAREIKLEAGRAYVEVARQLSADGKRIPFTMHTPSGPVTALGTKFAVDVSSGKSEVLVTEGKVTAAGLAQPLLAGQWWRGNGIETSPQAVHGLGWTREMRTMLAPPPVPPSQDMGGALRSADGSAVFTLRRCHVDVHVEDGMARTTIDQIYFNHLPNRQEGTFYFPLPADASISRLAMYVNGKLMEGGMAEREEARRTFETIKHKMQDPALLEWVDGSTFKMRVFPLEGREEKRIVISYVQKLDTLHGRSTLRVPLGHSLGKTGQWSFLTRIKDGRDAAWRSLHHDLKAEVEGSDLLLRTDKSADTMQRDVVLEIATPESTAPRLSSNEHEGARYVALRWTPDLPAATPPLARHWIFLVETSADRDAALAKTQREVLRGILNQASADDTFRIITASTRTTELVPTQPVTAANRDAALIKLTVQPNLGALDLGGAFAALKKDGDSTVIVHLGSATPILGETDNAKLLAQLPAGCQYASIGIGKRWNLPFARAAAAKTGGWFTRINPDESPGWRAFEFMSAMNAARLVDVKLDGADWRLMSETIVHGGELCAVAKLPLDAALPQQVRVSGTIGGAPWLRDLKLDAAPATAGWLPRAWAKLELDRLAAAGAEKHRAEIVALSKSSYVMSPFTSLLVLENDAMYEQYKIDRGRKDHWAMYPCPETIPVVKEPLKDADNVEVESLKSNDTEQRIQEALRTLEYPPDERFMDMPRSAGVIDGFINTDYIRDSSTGSVVDLLSPPTVITKSGAAWGNSIFTGTISGNLAGSAGLVKSGAGTLILNGANTYSGVTTINGGVLDVSGLTRAGDGYLKLSGLNTYTGGTVINGGTLTLGGSSGAFGGGLGSGGIMSYPGHGMSFGTAWTGGGATNTLTISGGTTLNFSSGGFAFDPNQIHGVTNRMAALRAGLEVPGMLHDFTLYADGFMTTMADRLVVAETAAETKMGTVDAAARALLDASRSVSTALTVKDHFGETWTVAADGRAMRDQRNPWGLREIIAQDGKTLRHLYPEIGLGTERVMSRTRWMKHMRRFPWLLPPVEVLALAADVKLTQERRIEIQPHDAAQPVWVLLFQKDGQLAETQILEPQTRRILSRSLFEREAGKLTQRMLNAHDRETHRQTWETSAVDITRLNHEVKLADLVVLPMPARREWDVREEGTPEMLATYWLTDRARLAYIIENRFVAKGDMRPGLFVLAMTGGASGSDPAAPSKLKYYAERQDTPITSYVRHHLAKHPSDDFRAGDNTFLAQFLPFRRAWEALDSWKAKANPNAKTRAEQISMAVEQLHGADMPLMLSVAVWQRASNLDGAAIPQNANQSLTALFEKERQRTGDWRLDARIASGWLQTDLTKAMAIHERWVESMLKHDAVILPDDVFRIAFERAKQEGRALRLTQRVVDHLTQRARPVEAMQWAMSALGMNERLLKVVDGIVKTAPDDGLVWSGAGEVYAAQRRTQEALHCVREALKKGAPGEATLLWRLVSFQAALMDSRQQLGLSMDSAELDEARDAAMKLLQSEDLVTISRRLAQQLDLLGLRDLAHDCRTSPLALKLNESQPWMDFATDCLPARMEEALMAYERAFAAEGTNAQILFTHAQVIEAQQPNEARKLYQKIADGTWGPNYNWVVQQAKQKLGRK